MILIALPMYNEEKDIEPYLKKLKNAMDNSKYKVLIFNDGSTDNSVKIVKRLSKNMPIELLHHKTNKGLGTTLKDLFLEIAKTTKKGDIVITMDSDNSHDPKYIREMVELIKTGDYNLIIASRYAKGGKEIGLSFKRSILSKSLALIMKILFPIKGVRDYSIGYRAYLADSIKSSVEKYQDKFIESKGFPGMTEILLKMRKATQIKAKEVPLTLRYDLKQGASKLNITKTMKEYSRLIITSKLKL